MLLVMFVGVTGAEIMGLVSLLNLTPFSEIVKIYSLLECLVFGTFLFSLKAVGEIK